MKARNEVRVTLVRIALVAAAMHFSVHLKLGAGKPQWQGPGSGGVKIFDVLAGPAYPPVTGGAMRLAQQRQAIQPRFYFGHQVAVGWGTDSAKAARELARRQGFGQVRDIGQQIRLVEMGRELPLRTLRLAHGQLTKSGAGAVGCKIVEAEAAATA